MRRLLMLFGAAILTSAWLLFLVQPMFAKMALPLLGGSPAVWTTCMLFFQATLLAGYAYAHAATVRLGIRAQVLLHAVVLLLPLFVLPIAIAPGARPPADAVPAAWLLGFMAVSLGLPFFAVSTSAPLLQRWFSYTAHAAARDPYVLYAASNVGSLAALLSYPTLVEPLLPVRRQTELWAAGYGLFALLTAACAIAIWRHGRLAPPTRSPVPEPDRLPADVPSWGRQLLWLALAFVPSSLMLAVTAALSTEVTAVPLLWVVPLSLYLLTFIVAFGGAAERVAGAGRFVAPRLVLPLVMIMTVRAGGDLWFLALLHLAAFTALALACHARLAADRPAPRHLTRFYLWVAAGGMLGGVLNSIVAPAVFSGIAEYPIAIVLGCALLATRTEMVDVGRRPSALLRPAVAGALAAAALLAGRVLTAGVQVQLILLVPAILVCLSLSGHAIRMASAVALVLVAGQLREGHDGRVLHAERRFHGVYRVTIDDEARFRSLFHGTTLHGRQHIDPRLQAEPLTYYAREGPIGHVLAARQREASLSRVAVVGLGTGTLATYARPGQQWTFYEIDPAIERLARDPTLFTYLTACGATCDVVIGDARLSLEAGTGTYDLIVLDAFSSDAIPAHLLTREAVGTYLARLAPGGLLAFHLSNRHLALRSVGAALADAHGLTAVVRLDHVDADDPSGFNTSEWMVMARELADVSTLLSDHRWVLVPAGTRTVLWTDDFSNIVSVLRWR